MTSAPRLVAVFLFYLLLGLLAAHPLATYFTSGLPYTHAPQPGQEVVERFPGDYLQYYYHLWLLRDGLFGPTPVFQDPYEFQWGGPRPEWRTFFLPTSIVFLLLSPFGSYAAYNGLVVVSSALAGLCMFLLAREVAASGWAALLAGVVFMLAPYRHATLMGGHPGGSAFYLVPLILFAVERAIRTGRVAFGILGGGALLSLALIEPHFLYFLALVLPVFVVVRTLPPLADLALRPAALAQPAARRAAARALPAVALVAAAIVPVLAGRGLRVPVALGAWVLATVLVGAGWLASALVLARLRDAPLAGSLWIALGCLSPLAVVGLSALRLQWQAPGLTRGLLLAAAGLTVLAHLWAVAGHPAGRRRLAQAAALLAPLWPVAVAFPLCVGALWPLRTAALDAVAAGARSPREIALFSPGPEDWLARFNDAAGHAIYPGVLALGLAAIAIGVRSWPPTTPRAGRWVGFLTVLFLLAQILSLGKNAPGIPLYGWLYDLVPYFGFVRQTAKFQVLAFLALAVLAAIGLRSLTLGLTGTRAVFSALLILTVAGDYWPARPVGVSLLPTENRVHDILRERSGGTVAYVPIWPGESAWSSIYQFTTTVTRHPMLNGYSPVISRRYVNEVYWPLDHLNRGEVTESEYRRLRALGVGFLVVDRGAFPQKVSPFPSGFTLNRLRASPYVDLVAEDAPLWLFRIRDQPRLQAGPAPPPPTSAFGVFLEAERLPRRVGRAVDDPRASWGRVLRAAGSPGGGDTPGYLVLGARAGLPRGSFRIAFRLSGRASPGVTVGRIEAVADGGNRVLASRTLTGRDLAEQLADVTLALDLAQPEWVEFRVFWAGHGTLEVDYLYGLFADQQDPPAAFENDDFAFGYGPYRRFPPGEYVVVFRTRVDTRLQAPMVRVTAATAHERRPLATRTVLGVELETAGAYHDVGLPMRLDRARVLEILVDFLTPGVSVDQIRVIRRS